MELELVLFSAFHFHFRTGCEVPCTTHPKSCQFPLIKYLILEAAEAAEAVEAEEASEAEANVRMTVGDRLL